MAYQEHTLIRDALPASPGLAAAAKAVVANAYGANAKISANLTGIAGATLAYLTGIEVTAGGATGAATVTLQITGLSSAQVGGVAAGQINYAFGCPLGATVPAAPLVVRFDPPIPQEIVSTPIKAELPALGTGNVNASIVLRGFLLPTSG